MEHAKPVCRGAETILRIQPNSSISISYHPLFGSRDDLILLELDEKLLQDVLQERVTLRGQPEEDAVFCTQSKTYAMKFVATSNSAFLIPPSGQFLTCEDSSDYGGNSHDQEVVASVIKIAPGTIELNEISPRLDRLKLLLSENPYNFEEAAEEEVIEKRKAGFYSWDDLVNRVQASNDQLRAGLNALSAVEIDGYWRLVDEKYMDTILRMLLHNSVLNDWLLDQLREEEIMNTLEADGFPRMLANHCLHVYGSKVDSSTGSGTLWRLDEKRVCVHFAREILKTGKKKKDNFMAEWLQSIPDGMQASFDMLEGEVLTERLGVEMWVYAFSASSLPLNPAERFSMLFRERSKWAWKDLESYIRDLNVPGLSLEGLLLKYTRRTQPTPDAEPIFTAR
ncbi:hypothetical protein K2173_024400 [Erythroxylum novogranatense]|uniref:Sister chromatid cohesion protein DCC1 n=1 Tax=Erythroxylum novogranatense TaxID=1862640 RepID=A0AAV8SUZ0_9ROSI|nr:hypothetical protein K2173_024400 [Erythroxylum novogranatense]